MTATVPYDGKSYLESLGDYRRVADVTKENWDYSGPEEKAPASEPVSKVATSRIRILLSRPLTWAEREALETDTEDLHRRRINYVSNIDHDLFKLWVSPNGIHVWAECDMGSRLLYQLVADTLESDFVNVYPKAVRTFREYNGE